MNWVSACLIGLRSVEIFEIGWEMKLSDKKGNSVKKAIFWQFRASQYTQQNRFWLCENEFLCRVPRYLLWKNSKIKSTKKGNFWPKIKISLASSFLDRFLKFQRIWDLWGIHYLCSELEKKFQNLTHHPRKQSKWSKAVKYTSAINVKITTSQLKKCQWAKNSVWKCWKNIMTFCHTKAAFFYWSVLYLINLLQLTQDLHCYVFLWNINATFTVFYLLRPLFLLRKCDTQTNK